MGLFWLRSIRNNLQPYFFSIAVHRQRSVTEWLEVTCSGCCFSLTMFLNLDRSPELANHQLRNLEPHTADLKCPGE